MASNFWKLTLVSVSLLFSSASGWASEKIVVDPDVRARPLWYWIGDEGRCVGLPTTELISDIGPRLVAKAKLKDSSPDCRLVARQETMGSIAGLFCEKKKLESFYGEEAQCEQRAKGEIQ